MEDNLRDPRYIEEYEVIKLSYRRGEITSEEMLRQIEEARQRLQERQAKREVAMNTITVTAHGAPNSFDGDQWMNERDFYCIRCGEKLDPKKMVWLELNQVTGRYHKPGEVPEDKSQGAFEFGAACARRVLKNGGRLVRVNWNL